MYWVFLAIAAALAAAVLVASIAESVRTYETLSQIERVALWWWAGIAVVAFAGVIGRLDPLIGAAGLMMIGLGAVTVMNVDGLADRLGSRRLGFGPFWTQQSPRYWRFSGAVLAVIGAFWSVALR